MILEYKIACDNCSCIIDATVDYFIKEVVDDVTYHYCNENCKDGGFCNKCNDQRDN